MNIVPLVIGVSVLWFTIGFIVGYLSAPDQVS